MKVGRHAAVFITGAYCCFMVPVWAQPAAAPQPVFACSLGKRSVSVTASGHELIYKFGTPTDRELTIIASSDRKNVFYREDRYAGMEHQLRFINGQYSYIVYNMEGNSLKGASPISGLTVMKGTKTVSDTQCKHYAGFPVGFDFRSLPEDTEKYSAM